MIVVGIPVRFHPGTVTCDMTVSPHTRFLFTEPCPPIKLFCFLMFQSLFFNGHCQTTMSPSAMIAGWHLTCLRWDGWWGEGVLLYDIVFIPGSLSDILTSRSTWRSICSNEKKIIVTQDLGKIRIGKNRIKEPVNSPKFVYSCYNIPSCSTKERTLHNDT